MSFTNLLRRRQEKCICYQVGPGVPMATGAELRPQSLIVVRRESRREFQFLGPDAQKDPSPTVFSLKVGNAKIGLLDDL